jgi:hypothetical protein
MDVDNPDGVAVILVNKFNRTQELKRKRVFTKNGKIPLKDICDEWCLKSDSIVWNDEGVSEPVRVGRDGYSDMAFSFINEIVLMGDALGINQGVQAVKHMNDQMKSNKPAASSGKKPLDLEVTVEQQQEQHPNVKRLNAFSSLVKNIKEAPKDTTPVVTKQATQAPSVDKETQDHLDKLLSLHNNGILTDQEYEAKKKQILDKAKQPTSQISQEQQEQLNKLQSLLDKGILTQQEFDAKKKQVLGQSSSPSTSATTTPVVEKKTVFNTQSTSTPVKQQPQGEITYDESKLTKDQKDKIAKFKEIREKGLLTKRDYEKKLREVLNIN